MEAKIFDISTLEGLKAAERYQNRLYQKYEKVVVATIGLDRVKIYGNRLTFK